MADEQHPAVLTLDIKYVFSGSVYFGAAIFCNHEGLVWHFPWVFLSVTYLEVCVSFLSHRKFWLDIQ